jgi:hypothetical protein
MNYAKHFTRNFNEAKFAKFNTLGVQFILHEFDSRPLTSYNLGYSDRREE